MDIITIRDLEVWYCVGVPEAERAAPQRLLLTVELELDISQAVLHDNLQETIDYNAVAQRLQVFGEGKSWKLVETLASGIAEMILTEFRPQAVSVRVKKFILPETRYCKLTEKLSRKVPNDLQKTGINVECRITRRLSNFKFSDPA